MIEGLEIIQEYSIEVLDYYGYNILISEGICKIKINLGSLMDRKNMSLKKLVKKINSYFLLEYICAFLGSEGLWNETICGDEYSCNIKDTLKKVNFHHW